MKLVGIFLLLAGWVIVFAAIAVLPSQGTQTAFVLCGIAVELIGLALMTRSHITMTPEKE